VTTEIVILAQGQRRLGAHGPAQLLPLPSCGGVPILCRTVRQVSLLQSSTADGEWWPKIVAWQDVRAGISWPGGFPGGVSTVTPAYVELGDPGNSALQGIARYLERRHQENRHYDRTIVLLGDVVYSWQCLLALWEISEIGGFVGTRDLALDKGELWGVAWSRTLEDRMVSGLRDALLRHPLGDEYQHGQLRRWVSGWRRGDMADHISKLRRAESYVDIDDYTHDIDCTRDIVLLPILSSAAAADDKLHDVTWEV
jgi:hypothetical protein